MMGVKLDFGKHVGWYSEPTAPLRKANDKH